MKNQLLIFLISLTLSTALGAVERSDAFIVKVFEKSIKVLAPKKDEAKIGVIVENKTLVKCLAKLVRENGDVIDFVSVEPGKFKVVNIMRKKREVIYFIPISPPFQKIELVTGRRPYEIPPQR
ncbi:MAG: hypothetical protein ACJAT2_000804 [Bacteriovoracaceae bacterium]|jgi:hypothetical protein